MEERIVLFVPCYVDQLRPRAGIAALELLERLGHAVEVRPDVVCCGQPFSNSGQAREGEALARRWYEGMAGVRTAVILSSSCTVQLRHVRGALEALAAPARKEGTARASLATAAADGRAAGAGVGEAGEVRGGGEWPEVLELCEFLNRRHPERAFGRLRRAVALHSSCHGLRDSDADAHARAVLARVEGLTVLRPSRPDECCGFGGTFSISFPALSVRMGEDRLGDLVATGAREVVATDLSCLLHLEGIAGARGEKIAFRHVGEILREAVGP